MGERHLFLVVSFVMLFVIGPVLLLVPLFAWHYRRSNTKRAFRPAWNLSWPLEFFIWVPPTLIVAGLSLLLWYRARQFDPYAAIPSSLPPLEVQAVALNWKWLFIYPDANVATINELVIPAGRPVHISLTSATVMQSMFIPQLAGQIYAMSGMTTQLNFAADAPGRFLGQNAQYNGEGFSHDQFIVLAMTIDRYNQWLAQLKRAPQAFDSSAFAKLFKDSIELTPVFFSSVEPGLFQKILARSTPAHQMVHDSGRP